MSCFVMINQVIQMMFKNSALQPNSPGDEAAELTLI